MASCTIFAPKLFQWEGGYVNDPTDRGGATNSGITLATWKAIGYDKDGDGDIDADDVKLVTKEEAFKVLKMHYWDRCKGDQINNQSVAELIVDMAWLSGKNGPMIVQKCLNLQNPDGIIGPLTVRLINMADQEKLHRDISNRYGEFILNIVRRDPTQERFLNGWMRRLRSHIFIP